MSDCKIFIKPTFLADFVNLESTVVQEFSEFLHWWCDGGSDSSYESKTLEIDRGLYRLKLSNGYITYYKEIEDEAGSGIELLTVDNEDSGRDVRRVGEANREKAQALNDEIVCRIKALRHEELEKSRFSQDLISKIPSIENPLDILNLFMIDDAGTQRLLRLVDPKSLKDITQEPSRSIGTTANGSGSSLADQLEDISAGLYTLSSFLIRGDHDQRMAFAGFQDPNNVLNPGQRLIIGGPGSGKTMLAIYGTFKACLEISDTARNSNNQPQQKVLFSSFTKAIVDSSTVMFWKLAEQLDQDQKEDIKNIVEFRTVDNIARFFAPGRGQIIDWEQGRMTELLKEVITEFSIKHSSPFGIADTRLLVDEFKEVIEVNGFTDNDSYIKHPGPLSDLQKAQIWDLYDALNVKLAEEVDPDGWPLTTWGQLRITALEYVKQRYAVAFVDEFQDLTPVGLILLRRSAGSLSGKNENIVLFSDPNQSIYEKRLSSGLNAVFATVNKVLGNVWSRAKTFLGGRAERDFDPEVDIIKRNYRNSIQIWKAIENFNPKLDDKSVEMEPQGDGPLPKLYSVDNYDDIGSILNQFLRDAILSEKVSPGLAAVICGTNNECKEMVRRIDNRFQPKHYTSKEYKLDDLGVKVITNHTAKGLEFPIAAVVSAGVTDFFNARRGDTSQDALTQDQSLRFVALSRAGRHLAAFVKHNDFDEFLSHTSAGDWEIHKT